MKIYVKKKQNASAFDNFEIFIPEEKIKDEQVKETDVTMETENHDFKKDILTSENREDADRAIDNSRSDEQEDVQMVSEN